MVSGSAFGGLRPSTPAGQSGVKNAKSLGKTFKLAAGSKTGIGTKEMPLPKLPESNKTLGIAGGNPMDKRLGGSNPGLAKLRAKYKKGGRKQSKSESNALVNFYQNLSNTKY